MSILDKFKIGFKKSAYTFTSGLRDIIVKKEINDKTLNQIEEYLIQSDVGVEAALEIRNIIAQENSMSRMLQYGPEVHGPKVHGPCRYTFFLGPKFFRAFGAIL